ncbi:ferric-dicitrate binding protein FerR (iron transport regulator) [Dyadobacter sp. BE34]|uniref:Ferric-dicitrate binding protein FerR (Iron transport regulator) n=1 Tax=Dyadobacter fermentans TaxID=94254 RepID=A0ABU1R3B2_9BACT|nr:MULTISPECIES: FecR domain-containing protein [Dyadobacter]MDR6807414.1 ferric-dicitrate binding protein FerR (iron transport regulator) [Dyadobacter fermentans]MDR7045155.1 ferric-dicitrate binding protein FerR (iron transport regulator) [Dyadobacter sp. BE242]MDR7199108.1 ferric-dicitrate binding protein FerR (iron transport regulator) [Dyadobacter sp. BE34]MDR7217068.1 ferric-dicitrate binding protein FerR (iron transport regulator) [Dyadobacter sp. BE31]MDR7265001.1 ferric-dicitrate bind
MSDHTPWPLIAKYLAGECSPEEKLAMEWWLEEYDNLLLFRQIEAAWKQEKEPENDPVFGLDSGLSKLHAKMAEQESRPEEEMQERPRYFKLSSWMAAAGVLLATGLGYFLVSKQHDSQGIARVPMETRTSGSKDIVSVELPDGTQVWLNKNSKLEYPKAFDGDERKVYLQGEAFFEVVPNPEKPFIVKSEKISTRVLGTSFDVKAYNGNETASVSVATGKVEVSKEIEKGSPIRITQLTPQQELVINTEKDETYIDIVSTYDIGAWRKDQLVFRNNTYSEVIARLEEHYGVKITLTDKNLNNCRVMANFNEGATLKDVLKLLSISNSFRYNVVGNEVIIRGGACR